MSSTSSAKKAGVRSGERDAAEDVVDNEDDVGDLMDDNNEEDRDEVSTFRDPPVGSMRLRPSQFKNLPSVIFMEYPPELGLKRVDTNVLEPMGKRKLIYKSHWERICIKNAFLRAGFEKTEESKQWTAMFSKHQNSHQMRELNCLQKVNHFPASWCIGRKDRLMRTINAMKRLHGRYFDFHPDGFILPQERQAFMRHVNNEVQASKTRSTSVDASARLGEGSRRPSSASLMSGGTGSSSVRVSSKTRQSLWIVKPVASSCGKGISVVTGQQAATSIPKKRRVVVQKYLEDPYLIDGKKFDLRIYVLVSGVDPLRVYVHNEGLTRISTKNYSLKNINNKFAHLTNYSINKNSDVFKAASIDAGEDGETEGFKWSLAAFRKWLAAKEGPEVMRRTMDRICDLCLKTMIAAEGDITPNLHSSANYRTNCYELFGCDVILDSNLNPHLLEVNVSPSLMGSSPLDKKIKGTLVADIFHTVGLYPYDPSLLKKFDTESASAAAVARLMGDSTCTGAAGAGYGKDGASSSGKGSSASNPFAFNSLSKMMASQENWRKNPSPHSIDFAAIGENDACWLLLLMAEDEFARARSTQFLRVHPTAAGAAHYVNLYRSCRFSDHLLARWVIEGGSNGSLRRFVPTRFLREPTSPTLKDSKALSPAVAKSGRPPLVPTSGAGAGTGTGTAERGNSSDRKEIVGRAAPSAQRTRCRSASPLVSVVRTRVTSFTLDPDSDPDHENSAANAATKTSTSTAAIGNIENRGQSSDKSLPNTPGVKSPLPSAISTAIAAATSGIPTPVVTVGSHTRGESIQRTRPSTSNGSLPSLTDDSGSERNKLSGRAISYNASPAANIRASFENREISSHSSPDHYNIPIGSEHRNALPALKSAVTQDRHNHQHQYHQVLDDGNDNESTVIAHPDGSYEKIPLIPGMSPSFAAYVHSLSQSRSKKKLSALHVNGGQSASQLHQVRSVSANASSGNISGVDYRDGDAVQAHGHRLRTPDPMTTRPDAIGSNADLMLTSTAAEYHSPSRPSSAINRATHIGARGVRRKTLEATVGKVNSSDGTPVAGLRTVPTPHSHSKQTNGMPGYQSGSLLGNISTGGMSSSNSSTGALNGASGSFSGSPGGILRKLSGSFLTPSEDILRNQELTSARPPVRGSPVSPTAIGRYDADGAVKSGLQSAGQKGDDYDIPISVVALDVEKKTMVVKQLEA